MTRTLFIRECPTPHSSELRVQLENRDECTVQRSDVKHDKTIHVHTNFSLTCTHVAGEAALIAQVQYEGK